MPETTGSRTTRDYRADQVPPVAGHLRALYADVYAEPPYHETESDAADFEARLAAQLKEPAFLLLAAWDGDRLIGYIYGFAIDRDSPLWAEVFLAPEDPDLEPAHETVFVSELLVAADHRGQGIARALHDRFLAARDEPTAVLLAHPDAIPAQTAYRRWGWYRIGIGRPWPGMPTYQTLVKDLREVQGQ